MKHSFALLITVDDYEHEGERKALLDHLPDMLRGIAKALDESPRYIPDGSFAFEGGRAEAKWNTKTEDTRQ